MIGMAIGGVVGVLVGAIGGLRGWSFLKTVLIANAVSLPLLTFVLWAGSAA